MIKIENLRNRKPDKVYDIRVDRSSILGNPFPMKSEKYRSQVIEKYSQYLINTFRTHNTKIINEIIRLRYIYETYGKLNLFCWCAPKDCHARIIIPYITKESWQKCT